MHLTALLFAPLLGFSSRKFMRREDENFLEEKMRRDKGDRSEEPPPSLSSLGPEPEPELEAPEPEPYT